MGDDIRMLKDRDVAAALGVSRRTIWRWCATVPDFPRPIRLAEAVTRWRADDLAAWIARRAGDGGGAS